MTRIIGGVAGGRRLRTPPGEGTRPTADRVREALFSALESALGTLAGRTFLDLYAGSGAVALEACSRGAERVTAVESDRRTAALIEHNAETVGLPVRVIARPVARVLDQPAAHPFDVVFADPPYPLGDAEIVAMLALLVDRGWVAAGAQVVLERSARSAEPSWPKGLVRLRKKPYGETVLWYVHAELDDRGEES